jgi:hypothetical protein
MGWDEYLLELDKEDLGGLVYIFRSLYHLRSGRLDVSEG